MVRSDMVSLAGVIEAQGSLVSGFTWLPCLCYLAGHVQEPPMTATPNRLFDDLARLMTDAAGAAQGMKREVEGLAKSQMERMLRDMDLVTRDEFEAVREMAVLAREENEALKLRLAALEAGGAPTKLAAKKPKG